MIPWHARARHRKPLRQRVIVPVLIMAAALALAAGFIPGIISASAAPAAAVTAMADRAAEFPAGMVVAAQDKNLITLAVLRGRAQAAARAAAVLAAHTYTVRAGDSMSSVAARRCGTARDWTGIYAASRARHWTAGNANVLTAGQRLYLSCAYLPSMLRYAPAPPPPPVVHAVTVSAVSTGHHHTYHRVRTATASSASSYSSSGTYSYAGLERLWVSAGGPSWAAAHAASIAECESGGRVNAYNPSGATGLWQILGSVVPGSLYNAYVNALNAVAKFRASGQTFAQWVCKG
jgi:hypothetical protein